MICEELISIIIPTYNRERTIIRAIKSVIFQSYKNFELIIVDDGSTDNTKEILKPFLENKKINYYYKENGGVSSARNLGIKKAKGEYIAFLDSDDEFLQKKLEIQIKEMKRFNNIFSISNSIEVKMKKEKKFNKYKKSFLFDQKFYLENKIPISASFFMIKNKNTLFFNEKLLTGNDIDFLYKYLISNKCLFVSTPLVRRFSYIDNIRLSSNPKKKIQGLKERINLLKKNEYKFSNELNLKYISNLNLNLGFWYLYDNKFIEGREYIKEGLKFNNNLKIKIKYYILYYFSFFSIFFIIIKKIGNFLWSKGIIKCNS
jgi:glycosyltransferase involved in cell wall biosynthesis